MLLRAVPVEVEEDSARRVRQVEAVAVDVYEDGAS
jgi:hypothetical protein